MKKNIWQGFKPYNEEDAEFFNGRSEAIHALLKIIETKTITVCYAESGVGKSSLINAGIVPRLREQYLPISIRFSFEDFKDKKQEEIKPLLCKQIVDAIRNAKKAFEEKNEPYKLIWNIPEEGANVNLSDLWVLLRNTPKVFLINGSDYFNEYKPFLILDQFEQMLYDSNSPIIIETFFELLKDLVLNDTFSDRYLMLREKKLVKDEEDSFKVLVSIRQEYIGALDYWCMSRVPMPSLHDNRFSLQPLTMQEAKEVVLPKGYDIFEDVVDNIIEIAKANNEVSSILLSVICRKLFEQAPILEDGEKAKVSVVEVEQKKETIIKDYYKDQLKKAQEGHELLLSDEMIHQIEDVLVNDDGKRTLLAIRDGSLQGIEFSESIKNQLENNGIIRSERIGDNIFVELIHDKVATVVLERKNERKYQRNKEERRKANYKRFLSRQNPLTLGGRQIWDNKTFTFSVDNSRSNSLNNSSNRTEILKDLLQQSNNDDSGVEQLFFDKLFRQTVDTGKISLNFNDNCSKDGISVFEIETERVRGRKQLKIKEIRFFDIKSNSENEKKEAFYTADGFCGIRFEYDKETGNEIRREYICDEYTSVGIVSIEFVYKNNGYGLFPTKAMYFDAKGSPCKHIDGNYGLEMEFDDYGRETCRWFLDQQGNRYPIYNGVYGLKSMYDDLDRVIKQYFIDQDGKRIFDDYGFHGVEIKYYDAPNELLASETIHLDINDSPCNSPEEFCIEQFQYDEKGRIIWQVYLDKDRNEVERKDGVYFYSKLKIGYNESDKPDNLAMYNLSGIIFKVIRFTYTPNGTISECSFYVSKKSQNGQIERKSKSNDNAVHKVKYYHDKHGLLVCQEYFDENDNPTKDSIDTSKVRFSYNNGGVFVELCFYNFEKSADHPIRIDHYDYLDEGKCEITQTEFEIRAENKKTGKLLGAVKGKKKKEEHLVEEKDKSVFKGVINPRRELVKAYWDQDNDYIPGTPLTVRRKYDINGNVVEELLFDKDDKDPICDKDGVYGWHFEYNTETRGMRQMACLGEYGEIANNKYGYSIIEYSNEEYYGGHYSVTSYFEKDRKPAICEDGYHKKLEEAYPSYNDELCRKVHFLNCKGEPCDCKDGYSRQLFEEEQINNNETKLTVSFWGADETRRINKALGYHKRELYISKEKEFMETSRTFWGENDELINVGDGFAKQTCKLYDSFWTYFHYPFTDYKVIRFYDKNDQKADVDFGIDGKTFHAYKYIVSKDWSSLFKVSNKTGKTLYMHYSLLWKSINIILIPVVTIIILIALPFYSVFKWLISRCKPKQATAAESATIIRVAQVFDVVPNGEGASIQAPIRQFDVEEGCWIVNWNNWKYEPDVDVATAFETEFNNSSERKLIKFYNPNEKEFLDIDITCQNLGLRIQDAQVPKNEVDEMMKRWQQIE